MVKGTVVVFTGFSESMESEFVMIQSSGFVSDEVTTFSESNSTVLLGDDGEFEVPIVLVLLNEGVKGGLVDWETT